MSNKKDREKSKNEKSGLASRIVNLNNNQSDEKSGNKNTKSDVAPSPTTQTKSVAINSSPFVNRGFLSSSVPSTSSIPEQELDDQQHNDQRKISGEKSIMQNQERHNNEDEKPNRTSSSSSLISSPATSNHNNNTTVKTSVLQTAAEGFSDTSELRSFRAKWKQELDSAGVRPNSVVANGGTVETNNQANQNDYQHSDRILQYQIPAELVGELEGDELLQEMLEGCESIETEPVNPQESTHIASLPMEIMTKIFGELDVVALSASSRVCKYWFMISRQPNLWKPFCFAVWNTFDMNVMRKYGRNWRRMYIERARLRYEGIYISKNTYVRPGSTEGSYYQPVYQVAYFRIMRFFPDGSMLYHMGAEKPRDVAEWMKGDTVKKQQKSINIGFYSMDSDMVTSFIKGPRNITFNTITRLSSTFPGAHNRLTLVSHSSMKEGHEGDITRYDMDIKPYQFVKLPQHLL